MSYFYVMNIMCTVIYHTDTALELLLFPWTRNSTLIAQYWLVPGMDVNVIYINKY